MLEHSSHPTFEESYHAHHSPLGAFATFTIGLVGSPGGFGHGLRGAARQNVYVGFKRAEQPWQLLPFFKPAESAEGNFTGEAATVRAPNNVRTLSTEQYERELGWASDTWRAEGSRFGFCLLSPFAEVSDPKRLPKEQAKLALSPHVNGWLEFDNSDGQSAVELIFGLGEPDDIFHPLQDTEPGLLGFALGTQFAYATTPASKAEPRQGFSVFEPQFQDHRGLLLIGGESALVFNVPARSKKRFPLVFAFYHEATVTTGIKTRYAYTRHFDALPEVVAHGLAERKHYEALAAARDRQLSQAALDADQKFLIAQASHSYLGNTQLLWGDDGPLWVVNEGEYRMMNTFDLTVDHLFFELRWFPWAVRNVLDLFVSRYAYRDRITTGAGESKPGGISFTHDMGVHNNFTPAGHSSYECDHLHGCFSHMTMEQLLNWVLCAVCYGLHTGDKKWLKSRQDVLLECAESIRRRDNPVAAKRDGVMKHDSLRCGHDGAEITTYDSLDTSLGQARNNLYLSVKTLGAWTLLEAAFAGLGLAKEEKAATQSAAQLAATLETKFDADSGTFPAVFEAGNSSRIIPAVEGFAYPLFLSLSAVTDRNGRFSSLLTLLEQHLSNSLKPGVCIDAKSGGWKMSSTSTNTWFSKIAIAQHVVRRMFPNALSQEARAADRVHARWQQTPGCGTHAMCDQIRSDSGETCGSRYYPRGVTAFLWLEEGKATTR
jgi:hypothetical protein